MIQPSTLGSNTFLSLLKSLHYMCTKCGDIAVALINMDFGRTLRYLLIGHDKNEDILFDVSSRPLPQLREIIELIGYFFAYFVSFYIIAYKFLKIINLIFIF